jgi:hypothetical protein
LHKQRKWVLKQLAALESKLSSLGGHGRGRKPGRKPGYKPGRGPGRPKKLGRGGKRPKNSMSLVEAIRGVLGRSGAAMKVGDIMDAVKKSGYKSSSANFRGIINQTLIKDKQFKSAARGTYGLK